MIEVTLLAYVLGRLCARLRRVLRAWAVPVAQGCALVWWRKRRG